VLLRSSGLHGLNGNISWMKRITVPCAEILRSGAKRSGW